MVKITNIPSKTVKIQQVMRNYAQVGSNMSPDDLMTALTAIEQEGVEKISLVKEIAKTHVYETEVVLKNVDMGGQGLANNPDVNLYYRNYGGYQGEGDVFKTSHIKSIVIEINIQTLIIKGYRGSDYPEKKQLAIGILEKFANQHCYDIFENCSCAVTEDVIRLNIAGLNENTAFFTFEDYGLEIDKFVNSAHDIMKEADINRADVKFVFDTALVIVPKYPELQE